MKNIAIIDDNDLLSIATSNIIDRPFICYLIEKLKKLGIDKFLISKKIDTNFFNFLDLDLLNDIFLITKNTGHHEFDNQDTIVYLIPSNINFLKLNTLDSLKITSKALQDVTYKVDVNAQPQEIIDSYYKLSRLEIQIKNQIIISHMNNGVIFHNPFTSTIGSKVIIEKGATIESNTIILGNSKINEGAIIGPNSYINDSIVKEGTKIVYSMVENSQIGKHVKIGPFAHLRDHCQLSDNLRIGNFVEIKNSTINHDTKISHLTYIGDTECGYDCNFGCGTVIVNYDGNIKHHTKIGNNAFIGCNSNLIAPLEVGDNTFIAAGSTITENLDDSSFAIARARQITKENYAEKYPYFQRKKS